MTDRNEKGASSTSTSKRKGKAKKDDDVLDSWENETLSSDEDEDAGNDVNTTEKQSPASYSTTTNPPGTDASDTNTPLCDSSTRTPLSPPLTNSLASGSEWSTSHQSPGRGALNDSPGDQQRRPEKQTAVANRIIAGALGVRAQRTEEQKTYDRTVRENERKRIAREREEAAKRKQDEERAKAAIWED